ncbi:alkaline shock response membrane anchor protein AmaP [Herpetosiphon sp. NSE202]|uniref:alkaline shock response membrane anchor protein AmaP n=1 Tax=Herpetosiphon sp. NSE202 TaxID=3351349 RepID=UPI00363A4052
MQGFNRLLITIIALALAVLAITIALLPLQSFDLALRLFQYLRAQALIYSQITRIVAGIVGLLMLGLALAQMFIRQSQYVPVRNTGSGYAQLDLQTIQRAVDQALGQALDVRSGKANVQAYGEGVAIYCELELHPTAHLNDTLADLHQRIREEVEDRLGVAILTLKSKVKSKPYPNAPHSQQSGAAPADLDPRQPAWDVRELRRRLERGILNQPNVVDLEVVLGYHPDGASVFVQLFLEQTAPVPSTIASVERLIHTIVADDFRLSVYDLRVTSQTID